MSQPLPKYKPNSELCYILFTRIEANESILAVKKQPALPETPEKATGGSPLPSALLNSKNHPQMLLLIASHVGKGRLWTASEGGRWIRGISERV